MSNKITEKLEFEMYLIMTTIILDWRKASIWEHLVITKANDIGNHRSCKNMDLNLATRLGRIVESTLEDTGDSTTWRQWFLQDLPEWR